MLKKLKRRNNFEWAYFHWKRDEKVDRDKLYKRYGWQPSATKNEVAELKERRDFAKRNACKKAVEVLDRLSVDYEQEYYKEIIFGKYS